jgi:hypothetical protein
LINQAYGIRCITIFPIALLVLRYEKASTVWENEKGLLGPILVSLCHSPSNCFKVAISLTAFSALLSSVFEKYSRSLQLWSIII